MPLSITILYNPFLRSCFGKKKKNNSLSRIKMALEFWSFKNGTLYMSIVYLSYICLLISLSSSSIGISISKSVYFLP